MKKLKYILIILVLLLIVILGTYSQVEPYFITINNEDLKTTIVDSNKHKKDISYAFQTVTDIAALTDISPKDYINASKLAKQFYLKLGILSIGYQKTEDKQILDHLNKKYPIDKTINHQEDYPNIYELIFEKPLKEITWEDMYQIKFVNQNIIGSTFIYSFSSPYDYENESEFQATCISIPYTSTEKRDTYHGYYPLIGCQKLITNVNLMPGDIIGKPYRFLTANIVTDTLNKLDYFASVPNLEVLSLRTKDISADDLSQLKHLKALSLQAWIFSGSEYSENSISIPSLTSLPTLERLYLEGYKLSKGKESDTNESLYYLSMRNCDLTDTNYLSSYRNLIDFSLEDCNISSLNFISTYSSLTSLQLLNNQIINTIVIDAFLTNLTTLRIDSNIPIDPFLLSTQLNQLSIGNPNDLQKLSAFSGLTSLELLGTEQTYDISLLPQLPNLEFLKVAPKGDYSKNNLLELPLLSFLPAFKGLWLENINEASGLNLLIRLNIIEDLTLRNMAFKIDPAAFMGTNQLKKLQVNYIGLDGEEGTIFLQTIGTLTELTYLDLSYTKISDLSFMANLQLLETFIANGNPITEYSILDSLTSLSKIKLK